MIYICIPTHNEQQTVGVVLWKLRQVLTEFHRDYQLLVADDASTDKTPDVLGPYTRVLPLTVIRGERRLGQAASLEMLLREAVRRSEYPKRDIIVTLQADFSEEPDDVVPMIKRIEAGADLVLGNKVSATRPTRLRRLARALGTFFTRSQQWPEGVTTPFDGYRAYRLYGVKAALEERGNRRLVQYDAWAGNAELLRAVLPHARRVEVLDVEDRADRLQRPRRERPFAAALRVRPMLRGVEPPGLVSVDELDRIAATASRSRYGAADANQRAELQRAEAAERGNGRSRQRGEGGRPRNGRDRTPTRADARDRGAATRAQASPKTAGPPQARPKGEKRGKPARSAAGESQAAGPAPAAPNLVSGETPAAGPVAEPPRSKKRRRRRRRGAGGAGSAPPQSGISDPAAGAELAAAEEAAEAETGGTADERGGTVEGNTMAREPKRRRRRGGRGRRRGPRAASTDDSAVADEAAAERAGPTGDEGAPPPVDPSEPTPAPAPPTSS